MKLSKALQHDFSPLVRDRGESYFWRGNVYIQRGSSSSVTAQVQGSRLYRVTLDWKHGGLELQKTKGDLAAAIIGADNGLIRDLGRQDLELLLS